MYAPLGAAALVASVLLGGCSFDPIRDISESSAEPQEQPISLAFVSEDATSPATYPDPTEPADRIAPGPWIVATDSAVVAVHSAPGSLYTRLGVLAPGETVLTTGRRVEDSGDMWMEITWDETIAWVPQAAFARG